MADSVFDNRYRYDYIYPRGRSGETLRAVDLEVNDRLVVIKRPAPNDAPPIRAGQEVSISNEQEALETTGVVIQFSQSCLGLVNFSSVGCPISIL